MGTLLYGNSNTEINFDDRALTHLQIVITAKLRRRESFLFSWSNTIESGHGRSSVWLDPSSTLLYRFSGSRVPSINRNWIAVLMNSANSAGGLVFSPEPAAIPDALPVPTLSG